MITGKTSDLIRAERNKASLAREKRSDIISMLSEQLGYLMGAIDQMDGAVDHGFLGYSHPFYQELTEVLLLISELQGPMDFSPQMLADRLLHRLHGEDV